MDSQEAAGDFHAVDIASLAQELIMELDATSSTEAQLIGDSPPCPIIIANVRDGARNIDPAEYDPHHVSIGPYHRIISSQNDPDLSRDDEKIRSLRAVLSAASPSVTVEVYLEELKRLREQATRCYQHHEFEGISDRDFVRMLLLDACYLLATFCDIDKYAGGCRRKDETNGQVQGALLSAAGNGDILKDVSVVRDVFYLVENQLPFFVIDRIHQLSNLEGSASAADTFARYIQELLGRRKVKYSVAKPNVAEPPGPGNLLHLLHMHLKPTAVPASLTGSTVTGDSMGPWRTATDYYYFAGVKFKKRTLSTDGCQSILDVRLVDGGGMLEIPCLNIEADTWRILRNLIALEQHNSATTGSNVTAYCVFMSQLACTASDVQLLSRRGVILHTCGNNNEVAGFFTDLCKGVVVRAEDDNINYLKATWQALEKRFQSRRLRWVAWLRQKYFKNPWLTVGLAAAAIGLACALVQAVYSVLSYNTKM